MESPHGHYELYWSHLTPFSLSGHCCILFGAFNYVTQDPKSTSYFVSTISVAHFYYVSSAKTVLILSSTLDFLHTQTTYYFL